MSMAVSLHEELTTLAEQGDYSQLSRKLLDLSVEYPLDNSTEQQIYDFRKAYLYATEASKESLGTNARTLVQAVKDIPFSYKTDEQAALVCDARNIGKRFYSGRSPFVLQALNVQLKFGEITGIVGENGNGKTTLLRILAGELSSDTGSISYPALKADDTNWYDVKSQFVFIPQRIPRWYGSLLDNLRFFASIHGIMDVENNKQVEYILFRLGLDKFRDLKWSELSSGYRLRFELAKTIMRRPKLILLDEPLANLDINAQQLFLQDLTFFARSAKHPLSIVLSSQQLHEVESISNNIIFIKQGETIYNGNQTSFATERITNTFEVSGTFNREQLQQIFAAHSIKIEDAGTTTVVTVDKEISNDIFLQTLLSNKISVSYFRDISTSTRKLFHKDI
jgi:ABC-2 type transport system ATP-binding protein